MKGSDDGGREPGCVIWGMKANGARVNPYALLELPFPQNPASATPVLAVPALPTKEDAAPTAVGSDTR
ncbi:MAG: Peptidase M23B [Nitrospira sp.]|nr:MAG: Peptidase M23B [Nitrospira sp.]